FVLPCAHAPPRATVPRRRRTHAREQSRTAAKDCGQHPSPALPHEPPRPDRPQLSDSVGLVRFLVIMERFSVVPPSPEPLMRTAVTAAQDLPIQQASGPALSEQVEEHGLV